jgi:hypothetical protein
VTNFRSATTRLALFSSARGAVRRREVTTVDEHVVGSFVAKGPLIGGDWKVRPAAEGDR